VGPFICYKNGIIAIYLQPETTAMSLKDFEGSLKSDIRPF